MKLDNAKRLQMNFYILIVGWGCRYEINIEYEHLRVMAHDAGSAKKILIFIAWIRNYQILIFKWDWG